MILMGNILMADPGYGEEISRFIEKTYSAYVKLTLKILQNADNSNTPPFQQILELLEEYTNILRIYHRRFLFVNLDTCRLLFSEDVCAILQKGITLPLVLN